MIFRSVYCLFVMWTILKVSQIMGFVLVLLVLYIYLLVRSLRLIAWQLFQEPSVPSLDNGVCQHLTPENFSASVGTAPLSNSVNGEDTCGAKTHSSLILRDGHFEQFISDNQKLTKRRGYLSDSGGAISQPLKKLREGNLVVANKEDGHNGSNKEFSCRFESPKSLNNMEKSVAQTTLDQFSSNHPWEENVVSHTCP